MDNILLFITGVLSGIIVGFIFSRSFFRKSRSNDGSKESFLEENLFKVEKNLVDTLSELESQRKEVKVALSTDPVTGDVTRKFNEETKTWESA